MRRAVWVLAVVAGEVLGNGGGHGGEDSTGSGSGHGDSAPDVPTIRTTAPVYKRPEDMETGSVWIIVSACVSAVMVAAIVTIWWRTRKPLASEDPPLMNESPTSPLSPFAGNDVELEMLPAEANAKASPARLPPIPPPDYNVKEHPQDNLPLIGEPTLVRSDGSSPAATPRGEEGGDGADAHAHGKPPSAPLGAAAGLCIPPLGPSQRARSLGDIGDQLVVTPRQGVPNCPSGGAGMSPRRFSGHVSAPQRRSSSNHPQGNGGGGGGHGSASDAYLHPGAPAWHPRDDDLLSSSSRSRDRERGRQRSDPPARHLAAETHLDPLNGSAPSTPHAARSRSPKVLAVSPRMPAAPGRLVYDAEDNVRLVM